MSFFTLFVIVSAVVYELQIPASATDTAAVDPLLL